MIKKKNSNFENQYAKHYDLIYEHKNYSLESKDFINLIKRYHKTPNSFLDFGCGTGKHIDHLYKFFNFVVGFDISKSMLEIAKKKIINNNVFFTHNKEFLLKQKFEIIGSFFDVFSYISPEDLVKTLRLFDKITNKGSLVFIQFWNQENVLSYPPKNYDNKIINKKNNTFRSCSVNLSNDKKIVELDYMISTKQSIYFEKHTMYLHSINSMKKLFSQFGFQNIHSFDDKKDLKTYSKKMFFKKK